VQYRSARCAPTARIRAGAPICDSVINRLTARASAHRQMRTFAMIKCVRNRPRHDSTPRPGTTEDTCCYDARTEPTNDLAAGSARMDADHPIGVS
jgi:hypothetical protein